jgi:hypothetical protein
MPTSGRTPITAHAIPLARRMTTVTEETTVMITNTAGLLALAEDAKRHGRNRQADVEKLRKTLDPTGVHLLAFYMPHDHVAGVKAEPHFRTQWKAKLRGDDVAADLWLDVSMTALQRAAFAVEVPKDEAAEQASEVEA